jgi:uncharacterized phage protein (TIGR02218 family)
MAFEERELSNSGGLPVALYEFTRGAQTFRYAAADRDVTFGGNVYASAPVEHQGVTQAGDASQDSFEINLAAASAVAQLYVGSAPSVAVRLIVRRWHYGDADAPIYWIGTVSECKQQDDATAKLVCNSIAGTFGRNGLRLGWQRTCPHALYDSECKVIKETQAAGVIVAALDGQNVQGANFALQENGRYRGGYIEWEPVAGTFERRAIQEHAGDAVALIGTTTGLEVGMLLRAYPGCKHTMEDCDGRFQNIENYGGFPLIPSKSPFSGDPVW